MPASDSHIETESTPIPSRARRAVAAVCLLLGIGALTSFVLIQRAHDTVFEPEFYVRHLDQVGVFQELSDDFVPNEVEEQLLGRFETINEDALIDARVIAKRTLPPAWFRATALQVSQQALPWLLNDTDQLEIHVKLSDRVQHAGSLIRARLPHSAVVQELYLQAVNQIGERAVERQPSLPFDIVVKKETWNRAITTAAPFPWVASNLSRKVGQLVAYLIGRREELHVVIPLYEQQAETARAVRIIVEETDTLAFVQSRIIEPAIHNNVEDKELLPSVGVVLHKEVIAEAFVEVLTTQWVQRRKQDIVAVFSNYIAGRTNELTLQVPLQPIKVLAAQRLTRTVDAKFREYFQILPECSRSDLARKLIGLDVDVLCRPPGYTYDETRALMGINIEALVLHKLDERIPDQLVHDESEIRSYVDDSTWYSLQRVRLYMQKGYEITEKELRKFVGDDKQDALTRVLEYTRNGVTVTDADVMKAIEVRASPGTASRLTGLRSVFGVISHGRWVALAVLLLVIATLIAITRDHLILRWRYMAGIALGSATVILILHGAAGTAIQLEFVNFGQELTFSESNSVASIVSRHAPMVLRNMARDYLVSLTRVAFAIGFAGICMLVGSMIPTPSKPRSGQRMSDP